MSSSLKQAEPDQAVALQKYQLGLSYIWARSSISFIQIPIRHVPDICHLQSSSITLDIIQVIIWIKIIYKAHEMLQISSSWFYFMPRVLNILVIEQICNILRLGDTWAWTLFSASLYFLNRAFELKPWLVPLLMQLNKARFEAQNCSDKINPRPPRFWKSILSGGRTQEARNRLDQQHWRSWRRRRRQRRRRRRPRWLSKWTARLKLAAK